MLNRLLPFMDSRRTRAALVIGVSADSFAVAGLVEVRDFFVLDSRIDACNDRLASKAFLCWFLNWLFKVMEETGAATGTGAGTGAETGTADKLLLPPPLTCFTFSATVTAAVVVSCFVNAVGIGRLLFFLTGLFLRFGLFLLGTCCFCCRWRWWSFFCCTKAMATLTSIERQARSTQRPFSRNRRPSLNSMDKICTLSFVLALLLFVCPFFVLKIMLRN